MSACARLAGLALALTALLAGCPGVPPAGLDALPDSGGSLGTGAGTAGSQTGAAGLGGESADCRQPALADAWRARILELVNQERVRQGLRPLEHDALLESLAEHYACEMIRYAFFSHVNPVTHSTLADRAAEFGYQYLVIGENLAAGQHSPEQVFESWMESAGHRQNILDPRFTELGVGVRSGGQYGIYWVQEFGYPLP